jgi:hypothetical protein
LLFVERVFEVVYDPHQRLNRRPVARGSTSIRGSSLSSFWMKELAWPTEIVGEETQLR